MTPNRPEELWMIWNIQQSEWASHASPPGSLLSYMTKDQANDACDEIHTLHSIKCVPVRVI